MALLVQWLSQADAIPLAEEDYSFQDLGLDWMHDLWQDDDEDREKDRRTPQERRALSRKFLDYIEANAEELWQVPELRIGRRRVVRSGGRGRNDDIYGAAYEGVTFRGSTEDDIEARCLKGATRAARPTDFELVEEAERIVARLTFLATLAQLWKLAAVASFGRRTARRRARAGARRLAGPGDRRTGSSCWNLFSAVYRYRIPPPRGTQEALVEFDRRRSVKEMLLEQIIATCVETGDAVRLIRVVMDRRRPAEAGSLGRAGRSGAQGRPARRRRRRAARSGNN